MPVFRRVAARRGWCEDVRGAGGIERHGGSTLANGSAAGTGTTAGHGTVDHQRQNGRDSARVARYSQAAFCSSEVGASAEAGEICSTPTRPKRLKRGEEVARVES